MGMPSARLPHKPDVLQSLMHMWSPARRCSHWLSTYSNKQDDTLSVLRCRNPAATCPRADLDRTGKRASCGAGHIDAYAQLQ